MAQRILLVDDEPVIVKMVQKRLETSGYEVTVAMDGLQVFEELKNGSPDLFILDLMLPGMNGYEVCERLKQDPGFKAIPVLIFSALAQDRDRARALQCGADDFIHKPFRAETLLDKVRRLLAPQTGDDAPSA